MHASPASCAEGTESLDLRFADLHEAMVARYERYVVAGRQWWWYTALGWAHLATCVASHYLCAVARVELRWPYALLWLAQTAMALGGAALVRHRGPVPPPPLKHQVDRVWSVFLLLSWDVAVLNVLARQPVFTFLPVLATLSSFGWLLTAALVSRRFLAAAFVTFVTGGLAARWPAYGFLFYGAGWLLVLQGMAVAVFRRRRRWLPAGAPGTACDQPVWPWPRQAGQSA